MGDVFWGIAMKLRERIDNWKIGNIEKLRDWENWEDLRIKNGFSLILPNLNLLISIYPMLP